MMTMTLAEKIAELRELEAKATPGPWEGLAGSLSYEGPYGWASVVPPEEIAWDDAEFVAYLRNNALAIIDEQQKRITVLQRTLKTYDEGRSQKMKLIDEQAARIAELEKQEAQPEEQSHVDDERLPTEKAVLRRELKAAREVIENLLA